VKASREALVGILYINRNCELYLGGEKNPYREDMTSLPLECILTREEYETLPEEEKKNYEILVARPKEE
jgi:hypothetical protein